MDTVLQELIKALPWGFVIIALRYLDIKEKADERRERDNNTKEKAQQEREHSLAIAKAYADAMNTLAKSVVDTAGRIENSIKDLREAMSEQYRNMGITQELLEVARQELTKQRK